MSCWTMGLNQSTHGTWNTNAICNLHLATGAICRPGSGPISLTGQPNAMGGREMGYMGPGLPGQRSVLVGGRPRRSSRSSGACPPGTHPHRRRPRHHRHVRADGRTARSRRAGSSAPIPSPRVANRKTVDRRAGGRRARHHPGRLSPTPRPTRYADIVLPAALWAEADGVMVNSERNLTLLQPVDPDPPGEARPDWQLICQVAAHMGFGERFDYTSSEEVFDEIRRFSNPADRLRPARRQLRAAARRHPCSGRARPTTTTTATRSATSTTASASTCSSTPTGTDRGWRSPPRRGARCSSPGRTWMPHELPDDDYPFVLNTGRLQHQWHTMTKTGKVAKLNKLDRGPFVEIHPDRRGSDSASPTGDRVEVASRRGRAVLPAVRDRPGAPGQLLRAVPLERRARRVPDRQRRDQRRRRPDLVAARVQGVRGERPRRSAPYLAASE